MKTNLTILAVVVGAFFACSSGDDGSPESAEGQHGFLLAEDLIAADVRTMPADSVEAAMQDWDGQLLQSWRTVPLGLAKHEPERKCLEEKLGALPVKAVGRRLVVQGEIDVAQCLGADTTTGTVIDEHRTVRVYAAFDCGGEDVTRYDGRPADDFVADLGRFPCLNAPSGDSAIQVEHRQLTKVKYDLDGQTVVVERGKRLIDMFGGMHGEECRFERVGDYLVHRECRRVRREVVTRSRTTMPDRLHVDAVEGTESYRRWEIEEGVVGPESGVVTQGRLSVRMNDWEGSLVRKTNDAPWGWVMSREKDVVTGMWKAAP